MHKVGVVVVVVGVVFTFHNLPARIQPPARVCVPAFLSASRESASIQRRSQHEHVLVQIIAEPRRGVFYELLCI